MNACSGAIKIQTQRSIELLRFIFHCVATGGKRGGFETSKGRKAICMEIEKQTFGKQVCSGSPPQ